MVVIVELKRRMAGVYIFGVIVDKLNYPKEPSPIILLIINKTSAVSLHCTVLLLGMAISLRVKSSRELLVDLKKVV